MSPNVELAIKPSELIGDHIAQLAETPAGYRAIALLDIGEMKLAQAELEEIDYDLHAELREPALAVGDALRMTQLVRDLTEPASMSRYVAAQYPIPPWQPRGGFAVDPALVYALVKQESKFDPSARNPSGATGLMQLMPGTAAMLGGEHVRSQLTDPETNLALGQTYVSKLLKDPDIDGDPVPDGGRLQCRSGRADALAQGDRRNRRSVDLHRAGSERPDAPVHSARADELLDLSSEIPPGRSVACAARERRVAAI